MSDKGLIVVGIEEEELFTVAFDEQFEEEYKPEPVPVMPPQVNGPVVNPQPEPAKQDLNDEGWRDSGDVKKFTEFLMGEMERIGNPNLWHTQVEKERGLGQLKRLNRYVSQALREDYDSVLDVAHIDKIRNMLEQHIDGVEYALDGVNMMKKQRKQIRKRRADDTNEDNITKEATAPNFAGLQIHISAFERAIVGALINGKVSGGRNMEELYTEAKEEYKFTPREELALFQILADMGYPVFKDRLRFGKKDGDPTREDGFGEWQSQYYA